MLAFDISRAELGKCPVQSWLERAAPGDNSAAHAGQDPLMPCSRAYFVNSAVLRMPNLRITFALWNATVLRWRYAELTQ